jgi:hypothetical protein
MASMSFSHVSQKVNREATKQRSYAKELNLFFLRVSSLFRCFAVRLFLTLASTTKIG